MVNEQSERNTPARIVVNYLHNPLTKSFLRVNGKQPWTSLKKVIDKPSVKILGESNHESPIFHHCCWPWGLKEHYQLWDRADLNTSFSHFEKSSSQPEIKVYLEFLFNLGSAWFAWFWKTYFWMCFCSSFNVVFYHIWSGAHYPEPSSPIQALRVSPFW